MEQLPEAAKNPGAEEVPESTTKLLAKTWIPPKLHINDFPSEILNHIFSFITDDDPSLLAIELTCTRWRADLIASKIYAKKCRSLLTRKPDLGPTFVQHRFESLVQSDFNLSKKFYFKLMRLSTRWKKAKPRITTINCLEAEANGKKLEVSDQWKQRYNYTGLYDLVWLRESSLLVCSVFDAIQVWDMSTYTCVNLISDHLLDGEGLKSYCFYAFDKTLLCGTNKGHIRVFDLMTGVLEGTFRHPANEDFRNYICDLTVYSGGLLAVDWLGNVQSWKILPGRKLRFVEVFLPPCSDAAILSQYTSKHGERLIKFNNEVAVTNVKRLFCIWDLQTRNSAIWVKTETYILCTQVLGRQAFWGEQNGTVFQLSFPGSGDTIRTIEKPNDEIPTRHQIEFKDSITSLSITNELAFFGDKNGEIHCCPLPLGNGNLFVLEWGHEFGAFVWAIQADGARIFSGDSNSKLLIHDFWDYEEDEPVDPDCPSKRQKLEVCD